MSDYKLVPTEPTAEMASEGARYLQIMSLPEREAAFVFRAMLAAAPAVQGDPVAWKEPAANWLREKAAAQQALNEQYPEHAKCYPTWESWVLKLNWLADELSAGAAAPQPAEQQLSTDVAALVEALELLVILRGIIGGALWSLDDEDKDLAIRTDAAIAALAAYRNQGGGK